MILCGDWVRQQTLCSPFHLSLLSSARSCLTLRDPMDCSMPGFPVHHHLPKLIQTHVYQVGDAIQPSHLLSSHTLPISSWKNRVKISGNEAFLTAAKETAPGLPGSNNKEAYIHKPHWNITKLLTDTGAPLHMLLGPAESNKKPISPFLLGRAIIMFFPYSFHQPQSKCWPKSSPLEHWQVLAHPQLLDATKNKEGIFDRKS